MSREPTPDPAVVAFSARAASRRAEDTTSLCVSCKLCCDGTLFGFVSVTDEEAHRLRFRLPIVRDVTTGDHTFTQRCVALGAGGCGIFPDRPMVCSTYRCSLLERVDAGLLERDDALDVVDRIRVLVARLEPALPGGDSFWPRTRDFRRAGAPVEELSRRAFALALADLDELDRIFETEIDERLGWEPAA